MRKISKPLSARFGEVILFRDDLERIANALAELGPVHIRTSEHHLDNFDELRAYPQECLTSLYLHTVEPLAYVDIDEKSVRLFAGADEPAQRRSFEKIRALLEAREAIHDRILESPTIIGALSGAMLSILVGAFTVGELPPAQRNTLALAAGAMLVVLLGWDRFTLRRNRHRTSQVWLQRVGAGETFWRRHGERVLIGLVASVVTLLIVLIINFFL